MLPVFARLLCQSIAYFATAGLPSDGVTTASVFNHAWVNVAGVLTAEQNWLEKGWRYVSVPTCTTAVVDETQL